MHTRLAHFFLFLHASYFIVNLRQFSLHLLFLVAFCNYPGCLILFSYLLKFSRENLVNCLLLPGTCTFFAINNYR